MSDSGNIYSTGGGYISGNINVSSNGNVTGTIPVGSSGATGVSTAASASSWTSYSSSVPLTQTATTPVEKTKVRHIIIRKDLTTLELREQMEITPREMIGISKLMSLVSVYVSVVLGNVAAVYNINICWSKLINELSIDKHFVDGLPLSAYNQDADVLDIFLYDPL